MASQTFYLSGKCKWAKVYKPDTEFEPQWNIQLYLDDDAFDIWKQTGLGGKVKEDEDGKYVTLRRKVEGPEWKPIMDPPEVVDAKGEPFDKLIGNGSEVTVRIEVYDTRKGKGHRIEKVRVDKHVVYERPADPEVPENKAPAAKPKGLPF